MLIDLLNPSLLEDPPKYQEDFAGARPFPHLVIDDFLAQAFYERLAAELPAFDDKYARNEMGEIGRKAVQEELPSIGPAYAQLDRLIRSDEFLSLLSRMTGMPDLRYDPDYIGGGTHENRDGQDLDAHIDFNYHPSSGLHRRANWILFLNPEWSEDWGGSLELHRDPWAPRAEDEIRSLLPIANRAVLFETSEISWHGFRRITLPEDKKHLSRRSIAVYFYTKERPAEQIATSHATVYVQRPLPEHIQPGLTLSEADFQEIRVLMWRRDQQIQFLYEREKQFQEEIEKRADAELRAELERNSTDGLRLELGQRSDSARSLRAELAERTAWALSLDAQTNRLREHLRALYGSPAYRLGRRLGLAPEPIDEES